MEDICRRHRPRYSIAVKHLTCSCIIVFTDVNLERNPTKRLTSMIPLPREGATAWYDAASDEQKLVLQQAADKLSAQLGQRRLLVRPYFQDFDR